MVEDEGAMLAGVWLPAAQTDAVLVGVQEREETELTRRVWMFAAWLPTVIIDSLCSPYQTCVCHRATSFRTLSVSPSA